MDWAHGRDRVTVSLGTERMGWTVVLYALPLDKKGMDCGKASVGTEHPHMGLTFVGIIEPWAQDVMHVNLAWPWHDANVNNEIN